MKFGFAGAMGGSVAEFILIARVLQERGHECVVLPSLPRPVVPWTEVYLESLRSCQFGIMGIGSFLDVRAEEERAARVFADLGTTFVALGDTPESVYRFTEGDTVHKLARHIVVADPAGVGDAEASKWREPKYLGLPPHLAASYRTMISPDRLPFYANQVGGVRMFRISDRHTTLFLPGTNDFAMDLRTLRLLEEAVATLNVRGGEVIYGYREHPNLRKSDAPETGEARAAIDAFFAGKMRLNYGEVNMAETMRDESCVTIFGGLSSELLPGAHAGIRAAYFADAASLARNERQGAKKGGVPIVIERGGFTMAGDAESLRGVLADLLNPVTYKAFCERRAIAFPRLQNGDSAIAYAEFLIGLAAERG